MVIRLQATFSFEEVPLVWHLRNAARRGQNSALIAAVPRVTASISARARAPVSDVFSDRAHMVCRRSQARK